MTSHPPWLVAPGAREFAYVEHFESGGQAEGHGTFGWAIRDARDKRAVVDGAAAMLFDLAADPFAQTDLLAGTATPQTTAAAEKLRAAYDAIHN
jgi:hypothetical protein